MSDRRSNYSGTTRIEHNVLIWLVGGVTSVAGLWAAWMTSHVMNLDTDIALIAQKLGVVLKP